MGEKPRAAAIYCRISQDRVDGRLGVQRQEEACRAEAQRLGWEIAEVYVDNDVSAYAKKGRPEYRRMCADIETGRLDGVLVLDQDRLVRHTRELEDFIDLAESKNIALANVAGEFDLSTSEGRFMARSRGALARYESEKQSQRIRRQREQAAKLGLPHGGRRAYGYTKTWDLDPEEAANVRDAARRYLAGESLGSIARDWNDRGVEPAYAKAWRPETLRTMLAGPHLAALRVHRQEVVGPGTWDPILSEADHHRLVAALNHPRRRKLGRHPSYLLTSCLRCGKCGAVLQSSSQPKRNRRSYICRNGPGREGCGGLGVDARHLEEFVADLVVDTLMNSDLENFVDRSSSGGRRSELLAELREVEELLDDMALRVADGTLAQRQWLIMHEAAEARRRAARQELAGLEGGALLGSLPAPEEFAKAWMTASIEWRRSVIEALFEHIVIEPAVRGTNTFDSTRVRPVWNA